MTLALPVMAAAEWTYLPIPHDMRGAAIVTTASVRARCSSVGQDSNGSRSCERSLAPPTFSQNSEIIETVPAGFPLRLLEVHYDQDGYALRVVGEREPFWIFEPHGGPSSVSIDGKPLENSLRNVYAAFLVGDMAAIFGPQDVQLQCFPSTAVLDNPIREIDGEETTSAAASDFQVPDFDPQAASAGNKFNPACQGFIGTDGEYGPWGKIIESELESRPHLSIYLSDQAGEVSNMHRICPNFTRLSREQKIRFWVWTFMSIAQVESTCENGVKGTEMSREGYYAQGLLQMEKAGESLDGDRSIWAKNPNPQRACSSPNIRDNAGDNLRCGLDAMANVLVGYHSCSLQEYIGQPPIILEPESCVPDFLNNKWERFKCLPEHVGVLKGCPENFDAVVQRVLTFKLCGAEP